MPIRPLKRKRGDMTGLSEQPYVDISRGSTQMTRPTEELNRIGERASCSLPIQRLWPARARPRTEATAAVDLAKST